MLCDYDYNVASKYSYLTMKTPNNTILANRLEPPVKLGDYSYMILIHCLTLLDPDIYLSELSTNRPKTCLYLSFPSIYMSDCPKSIYISCC